VLTSSSIEMYVKATYAKILRASMAIRRVSSQLAVPFPHHVPCAELS
jgi:hypothetical protein